MRKFCKILKYTTLLATLSTITNLQAAELNDSGIYLGIEYKYPVKTALNDWLLDLPPIGGPQINISRNNGGGGGYGSLTYITEDSLFVNAIAGYAKQNYNLLYSAIYNGMLNHKMIEGGINFGYTLDLDSNIKPYGSLGAGISNIKTELTVTLPTGNFMTNKDNPPKDTKPYFSYEGGLKFVTSAGIIKVGMNGKIIKNLNYPTTNSINLIDDTGAAVNGGLIESPFKNHIYNLDIGFLLPV